MSLRVRAFAASIAAVALIGASTAASVSASPNNNTVKKLTKAVTPEGVLDHLEALQEIADDNGGNRAAGRPGYEASVGYVVEQFQAAGYDPEVQEFPFDYFEENSVLDPGVPEPAQFVDGTDFLRNNFDTGIPGGNGHRRAGPGGPRGHPAGPANSSSSGCEAADFAGFPAGGMALMQRGTCGFAVKASTRRPRERPW